MAGTHVVRREVHVVREVPAVQPVVRTRTGAQAAFQLLRVGYFILPVLAGLDKFFHVMSDWTMYLATPIEKALPIPAEAFMAYVGIVEIAAGLMVLIAPRFGAWIVAAWLGGITLNLLLPPGYYDIALRDFGLMLGAIALGLMAKRRRVAVVRDAA
jgi:uncharacterized membrane protein YphA (DoxX/SURF4 family)